MHAGERVLAGTQFGGYASQVVVPAGRRRRAARALTFEQGAAIPVNYATAWAGLVGYGNLQPGERVLIHSAGGGVGIAATQIAKRVGAEVYGTASPGKHERIRELGVDRALDYTSPGWERGLRALRRDPRRGRRQELPARATRCCAGRAARRLRRLLASSPASGKSIPTALKRSLRMPRFNMIKQMQESKAVIGLNMLTLWKDRGTLRPWIEPLQEMLADGTIVPVVAGAFAFDGRRARRRR